MDPRGSRYAALQDRPPAGAPQRAFAAVSTCRNSKAARSWPACWHLRRNCCLTPNGVAAAGYQTPRGQAHSVRRRAGRAARRRSRHLSLRHVVQHGGGAGGDRHRHGSGRGRLCARHLQGLYDPRRPGPVPDRTGQRDRRGDRAPRQGIRVNTGQRRCGWFDACWCADRPHLRHQRAGADKLDILDGFETIEVCTGYRLDGKEIDHLPAGEGAQARVVPIYETIEGWKEPTANAGPGRTCRRRPSNMSAGSRNWWVVRLRCFPPAPNARILFWYRIRSKLNELLPSARSMMKHG